MMASDANYLPYVEITLKSLLMHNENLSVFILHTGDISLVIFHFTGPHKPLDNIFSENACVNAVISLFRLYASISWQDICSLPLGTTRANWINQER